MTSFLEWYRLREEIDMAAVFLKQTLQIASEKAALLPPPPNGLRSPKLRLTGNFEGDLYTLGGVDTTYLDELYTLMNQTGLYRGNNEVLRALHSRFKMVEDSAKTGGARSQADIERIFDAVEQSIEAAGNALDQMGEEAASDENLERLYRLLAEFYAGAGGSVAMAAKEYAVKHFSRESMAKAVVK